MGILWRLFAPKPLKKARRAMHPKWVIEDAIVKSVRGGGKKRRSTGAYRYCPRCRKRVGKTAKFCSHCAARL